MYVYSLWYISTLIGDNSLLHHNFTQCVSQPYSKFNTLVHLSTTVNQVHRRPILLHLLMYPLQCDIIAKCLTIFLLFVKIEFNFQILGFHYFKFLYELLEFEYSVPIHIYVSIHYAPYKYHSYHSFKGYFHKMQFFINAQVY